MKAYSYLGFKIGKSNQLRISYSESEYKDIITRAHNCGLTPSEYMKIIAQPCTSCGTDKVILDKLCGTINKKYKHTSKKNLFCFVNSMVNKRSYKTELSVSYKLRAWLGIPLDAIIYSEMSPSMFSFINGEPITLTTFHNGLRDTTTLCVVIDNIIHKLEH